MTNLGLNTDAEVEQIRRNAGYPSSNLFACPDCAKQISKRAINCPHCGLPVNQRIEIVSRQGWSGTIAGGVILGYFGILIINVILFFLFMSVIAGALSNVSQPRTPAPTYPYSR